MNSVDQQLQEAQVYISTKIPECPKMAIILGSGLGYFTDNLTNTQTIPTSSIPHYPQSTVAGHAGYWIPGTCGSQRILAVKGRVHFYEGYSMKKVTFPVRLLKLLGVQVLLVTNAAGSLNPHFLPGDLMIIDDQLNLFLPNPLIGETTSPASQRFIDMSNLYDSELKQILQQTALDVGIRLRQGTLVCSSGPSYETAAEISMMRRFGGDAISMSTVPEVIVAKQLEMKILGISCLTNMATGLSSNRLNHDEVTETAKRAANCLFRLMEEYLKCINKYKYPSTSVK